MSAILQAIGDVISSVITWITSSMTSVVGLFYDATNGFTFIGVLLLVGFGLSLVWVLINFIRGLVRRG